MYRGIAQASMNVGVNIGCRQGRMAQSYARVDTGRGHSVVNVCMCGGGSV